MMGWTGQVETCLWRVSPKVIIATNDDRALRCLSIRCHSEVSGVLAGCSFLRMS